MSDEACSPPSFWTFNVKCGVIANGIYSLGGGLYWMTVLPNFIKLVGGDKTAVGFAEGLQGIATMASALPAGYLADKWSRKASIRLGAVLQLFGGCALIGSLVLASQKSVHSYILCCVALCMQGVCDGIMSGPLVALMDDSCPAGRRSDLETWNTVVGLLAGSVGPIIGLLVFVYVGDTWNLESMKVVMLIGVIVGMLAIFPAWLMDDRWSLGEVSEAVHLQTSLHQGGSAGAQSMSSRNDKRACCGLISASRVRSVLFFGEVIMAMGAGMTVKFFPVFFDEQIHVDPAVFQGVAASLLGLTAIGNFVANRLGKRFGRLQVTVFCFCVGIPCTALLGLLRPYYAVKSLMLSIYVLRCVSQWSPSALMGSVVADYTPKATRGRWKALTSIASTTWSGSAVLGGWLLDHVGFGPTFLITACMQATVLPIWWALAPLVATESEILAAAADVDTLAASMVTVAPASQDSRSLVLDVSDAVHDPPTEKQC